MKNPILILLLLFVCATTTAQNGKNCYRVFADSSSGTELFGYRNAKGKTVLKPIYLATYTESFCQMAIVLTQKHQWLGINAQGKVILVPFIFDNGPDYVREGLFRFVENQKMGFANLNGQKIIPAQYSFVTPFYDGYAQYYIGGEKIYENGKTHKQIMDESGIDGFADLYWNWGGNITETGYINKKGQRYKELPSVGRKRKK